MSLLHLYIKNDSPPPHKGGIELYSPLPPPFCILTGILSLFLLVLFPSCINETITPDLSQSSSAGSLTLIDLPGIFAINIANSDEVSTRDENKTSAGNSFSDGLSEEFDLSENIDDEYYHYLLFYEKGEDNSYPLVFPIEISEKEADNYSANNITLTVSKVLSVKDDGDLWFNTLGGLKNYLAKRQAYVLLNFKLEDNKYIGIEKDLSGSTAEKLVNITKSEIEALQLSDYKVRGQKTNIFTTQDGQTSTTPVKKDFFIMTNSVYSDGSEKVIDGSFDTEKIFTSKEDAINNPAASIHMERMASKVTVSFNAGSMQHINFGPSEKDFYPITEVNIDSDGCL